MLFGYELSPLLKPDKNSIACVDGAQLSKVLNFSQTYNPKSSPTQKLADLLDAIGKASADSQSLSTPVTSYLKLANSNQRIYMKTDGNKILGYIKVGEKKLTYRHTNGKFTEIIPLCVLDFFVFPAVQRKGIGKQLFDNMLFYEKTEACRLAIDKPSFKFLSFLWRHYGLKNYAPQTNNFVIFDQFFKSEAKEEILKVKKLVPLPPKNNIWEQEAEVVKNTVPVKIQQAP